MASITIKGLDKLEARLGKIKPGVIAGIKAGALHIEGKVKKYPKATAANMPKQYSPGAWNTWYERGWGTKWATREGWHGNKSSEQLGQKWTTKISNGGLTARIGNNASYAPYVHGAETQSQALKRIGWKTDEEIADSEAPRIEKFIIEQIERSLG